MSYLHNEEQPMSPEDRAEKDRLNWIHYDRMVWGDPDAFQKHRDEELTREQQDEED